MPASKRSLLPYKASVSIAKVTLMPSRRASANGTFVLKDGIGAMNIRYKYREEFGLPHVVGDMAPPIGLRFSPHTGVAPGQLREAATASA
jgi:hypothetical protein